MFAQTFYYFISLKIHVRFDKQTRAKSEWRLIYTIFAPILNAALVGKDELNERNLRKLLLC